MNSRTRQRDHGYAVRTWLLLGAYCAVVAFLPAHGWRTAAVVCLTLMSMAVAYVCGYIEGRDRD